MEFLETLLIEYRWILVCLFLLPLSFVYNVATVVRERLVFLLKSDPKQHNAKVLRAQRQVKGFKSALESYTGDQSKRPILCTSRPGWQTMSFRFPKYKNGNKFQLNLEDFVDVIEFNAEEKTVLVEPMMSMRQINGYLLKLGYSLPIVPELDDLTIGGLVMGTGIESSSFKYGLFHRICLQFELLLPTGEVVKCDKDNNPELFHAVPWSYGTTGFLMSVRLQVIPVQKYIRLNYAAHETIDSFCGEMNRILKEGDEDVHFIEGLILTPHKYVLMTGTMTNGRDRKAGEAINRIGKWHKPWFYKHVDQVCFGRPGNLKDPHSELIPLMDYYHRHSRSIFWEMEQIVPMGNNFLFRFIFGWMQPIKIGLLKLTQTAKIKELYEKNHVIQDILVPLQYMKESIDFFDSVCRLYPLWICPFALNREEERGFLRGKVSKSDDPQLDGFYVDVGLYGVPGIKDFDAPSATRAIEERCREWNGFQMLYADTYMTKEEFHAMFNHDLYRSVRRNLGLDKYLPEVYEKINKNARI